LVFAFVSSFILLPSAFPQGSLTPPGPPAPTMKTLTQIEPRTDVATLSGDSNNRFIINAAGSYYFTGNIAGVSAKHGLSIQADNVTVDLGGFTLGTVGSTTMNGIDIPNAQVNIVIRNGVIRNWKNGVNAPSTSNSRFENLEVSNNNSVGLNLFQGSFVKSCVVSNNGSDGIVVRDNSEVIDCLSRGNTGSGVFAGGNGNTIERCTTTANQGAGIAAGVGSVIAGCAAQFNQSGGIVAISSCTINSCIVDQNTGIGISTNTSCVITECTVTRSSTDGINSNGASDVVVANSSVSNNTGNGIVLGSACRVTGSTISNNGSNAGVELGGNSSIQNCNVTSNSIDGVLLTSADDCINNNVSLNSRDGIHSISTNGVGFGNRIDGNQVRDNSAGGIIVDLASAHNLIVRNSAGNNGGTNNYNIASGNKVGPTVTDPSASTANAWANFVDP
jgi:hypothetical protein